MNPESQKEYDHLVAQIEATGTAKASKMFGMPCLKNEKGKAFAGYFNGEVTFKLPPDTVQAWLRQPGAKLFDPGMGRPMKEWLQLSVDHSKHWLSLATEALEYVNRLGK